MADIPFGFCVVPEGVSFLATGSRYQDENAEEWDNWASIVMRTRFFLVGTPVAPDSRGNVYLGFAMVVLPTEEGQPSQGLALPMARPLCLN